MIVAIFEFSELSVAFCYSIRLFPALFPLRGTGR